MAVVLIQVTLFILEKENKQSEIWQKVIFYHKHSSLV